jgi:tetraacyldisaccharide 4'-kinase
LLIVLYRILISPIALLYGIIIYCRNWMYDNKWYTSIKYDLPTICVGNLSMGGTGKSPTIEYLIELLGDQYKVATLSRGYKRKTTGFIIADENVTVNEIGDEPLQYFRKYKNIKVAVAEKRAFGVAELLGEEPDTQIVLLDDAFQHRSIQCGLYILVTSYDKLFMNDYLAPMGSLREWAVGAKRAQIIIVSKCPINMSKGEKKSIQTKIQQYTNAVVFFSYITYKNIKSYFGTETYIAGSKPIMLITGVGNVKPLQDYLKGTGAVLLPMPFQDHHQFTDNDLYQILKAINSKGKDVNDFIWLTTEKDAMRLEQHKDFFMEKNIPLFVQPISFSFSVSDKLLFNQIVANYVELQLKNYETIV